MIPAATPHLAALLFQLLLCFAGGAVLRNRRELVRRDRVGRTGRGTTRMTFLYMMKLGMKKVILFTN
jgi:hypothetical protein